MRSNPAVLITESSGIFECLDRLAAQKRTVRPLSTYRLQFNAGFRFEDAQRLVGYLHALGVSHIYSSPVLKARAGSLHGYDIIDHNSLNPEEFKTAAFKLSLAPMTDFQITRSSKLRSSGL